MQHDRSAADLTGKARIREAAIELFAAQGFSVSLRTIAAAAGVSPALVAHHFGSRAGLREATDAAVLGRFAQVLGDHPPADSLQAVAERWGEIARVSDEEPELVDYIGRALVQGDERSGELFRGMLAASSEELGALEARGLVRRTPDPQMRDLMFTLLDLGAIMLREPVEAELGTPMQGETSRRWIAALLDLLENGLATKP